MVVSDRKNTQTKLMKGMLDLVVLKFLNGQPMHGYQIITKIRKTFNVYFGPSTIYPLLGALEKKGYVKSEWNISNDRPRKVYTPTEDGKKLLEYTENVYGLVGRKLGIGSGKDLEVTALLSPLQAETRYTNKKR